MVNPMAIPEHILEIFLDKLCHDRIQIVESIFSGALDREGNSMICATLCQWFPIRYRCCVVLLLVLCGLAVSGHAGDGLQTDLSLTDPDPLRLPERRWLGLLVHVAEYYPVVEHADTSSEIRSLAVMPGLVVQVPDQPFRPYIGAGLGLSINGLPLDMSLAPIPSRIEESLVMHVSGGFAYHVGERVALLGSARFAQFKTTDFLGQFAPSSPLPIEHGLDFSAYTVQLGIRLRY